MKIWNWLPALKPRHTFEDVVRELIDGLRDGSIVLENTAPELTTNSKEELAKTAYLAPRMPNLAKSIDELQRDE